MRPTSTHRLRALVGAAATVALAAAGLVAATGPAQAVAGPTLTASKSTNLAYAGEAITVSGTGYAAGVALYVAECDNTPPVGPPTGPPPCDFAHAAQVTTDGSGEFTTDLTVYGSFGSTDCADAAVACGIATSNSNNPSDMAATATLPLSFAAEMPVLTLSKSNVRVGDVVTLTGTHFPKTATTIWVTICGSPPSATNCYQKLSDIGVVNYDGSGGFTFNYTVKALSYMSGAGQIDCAKVACVIGTTNGNNPADQSYASVAPITVAAPVAAAPGKAKITTAKQKGKKNVLLKWKAAKAHGTPVTKYKVEVKQKKAKKGWKSWKKAGTTDKTKLKWKNGKKGHVYKFRVVAKSKAGNSTSKVVKVKIKK